MSKSRYEEMLEQAQNYHKERPEVWGLFCKFTLEQIKKGFKNYSAQHGIFARIRWESDKPDFDGKSTFKINNNYSSIYARAFMNKYPEHEGFFRTRKQTSKDELATGLDPLGPSFFDNK